MCFNGLVVCSLSDSPWRPRKGVMGDMKPLANAIRQCILDRGTEEGLMLRETPACSREEGTFGWLFCSSLTPLAPRSLCCRTRESSACFPFDKKVRISIRQELCQFPNLFRYSPGRRGINNSSVGQDSSEAPCNQPIWLFIAISFPVAQL